MPRRRTDTQSTHCAGSRTSTPPAGLPPRIVRRVSGLVPGLPRFGVGLGEIEWRRPNRVALRNMFHPPASAIRIAGARPTCSRFEAEPVQRQYAAVNLDKPLVRANPHVVGTARSARTKRYRPTVHNYRRINLDAMPCPAGVRPEPRVVMRPAGVLVRRHHRVWRSPSDPTRRLWKQVAMTIEARA